MTRKLFKEKEKCDKKNYSAKTFLGGWVEEEKNAVSPFVNASGKQILGVLSVWVKRFGVSRMRDFDR